MTRLASKFVFNIFLTAVMFLQLFSMLFSFQCIWPDCTNYWNFEYNLVDQKNSLFKLFNNHSTQLTNDRKEKKNSALYLNNGYIQINSSSVSWTSDFTITVWVYLKTRVACGKLLDCGLKGQNELVINLNSCNGDGQSLQVYSNRNVSGLVYNRNRLAVNKWQHLAFTYQSTPIH